MKNDTQSMDTGANGSQINVAKRPAAKAAAPQRSKAETPWTRATDLAKRHPRIPAGGTERLGPSCSTLRPSRFPLPCGDPQPIEAQTTRKNSAKQSEITRVNSAPATSAPGRGCVSTACSSRRAARRTACVCAAVPPRSFNARQPGGAAAGGRRPAPVGRAVRPAVLDRLLFCMSGSGCSGTWGGRAPSQCRASRRVQVRQSHRKDEL